MARKGPARKTARRAPKRPTAKAADVTDAIRQLDAAFMKAANAKNAAAVVKAFYAPDAVLMPPNHPLCEGRADIQAFLQGLIDGGFGSIKLDTVTVERAGDLAYGRGSYTLQMAPPGGPPFQDVGKYIVVYRRQPSGGWRATTDIFNSDQAAG